MLSSDFHGWAFLHCITFVYAVRAVIHSYTQTRPPRIYRDSVPNCTLSYAREGWLESDTIPNESTHADGTEGGGRGNNLQLFDTGKIYTATHGGGGIVEMQRSAREDIHNLIK